MNFSDFYDYLSKFELGKVVIIGLGNSNRGDDGAGLYLLNQLRKNKQLQSVNILAVGRTPENYLEKITSIAPELVVFIDAISNARKNSIQLIDSDAIANKGFTTHSYSLTLVEDYLKNYNDMEIRYLAIPVEEVATRDRISEKTRTMISNFLSN